MARSLPRPLQVLPRSTSDARPRLCSYDGYRAAAGNPVAVGYRAPTDNHAAAGYRAAVGCYAAARHRAAARGRIRRAACSVQCTTCNVMNTRDEQHATKNRAPRAHDTRDENEQVRTRGATVPIVLRTARTMPSMALTVLTRGTVARLKPPLIGVQRIPATGDLGAHRADGLCCSWGKGH